MSAPFTASQAVYPSRPATVTTVVVLTWIAGLLDIVVGAALWALATNADVIAAADATEAQLRAIGISSVVIGVLVIIVAIALSAGSRSARIFLSAIMVLRVAGAVVALVMLGTSAIAEAATALVIGVVILALLWNRTARDYFAA